MYHLYAKFLKIECYNMSVKRAREKAPTKPRLQINDFLKKQKIKKDGI